MQQARIIFHHPLPVHPDAQSASGIRPYRMLQAFRTLGYEVDAVCGYAAERARAIAEIDRRLRQGIRYDFMYGESATEPTLLTEPHHLPLHPRLDFGFMARLKARGIPLGLFYRDIYWRFPDYGRSLPGWKRLGALALYRYDLLQYRRLLDRLYLPSLEMVRHVPWVEATRMAALPPGLVPQAIARRPPGPVLHLLYVGGIGTHYPMHELFDALQALPEVRLTVCTREAEWRAVAHEYSLPAQGNVQVVHRSGEGLHALYETADLCLLFVKPQAYWEFAVPFKLYEYLSMQRPVIASAGTLSGDQVQREGIGWAVPYEARALTDLLRAIVADRTLLASRQAAMLDVSRKHSWIARAEQVAADLASPA